MSRLYLQVMDQKIIFAKGARANNGQYLIEYKKIFNFDADQDHALFLYEILDKEIREYSLVKKGFRKPVIEVLYSRSGILYRIVKVPFMPLDDLGKMMEFEMADYLSVEPLEYETRYQIIEKYDENGQIFWDIAVAGVEKQKINQIIGILDNLGLDITCVDILPSAYQRLFIALPEKDLMLIENDGNYSRICILKEGKVFLYADFPINNQQLFAEKDYGTLITEIRGYMEYFSSRNFGKNVEAIILLGDYSCPEIAEVVFKSISITVYDNEKVKDVLELSIQDSSGEEICITEYYGPLSRM